MAVHIFRREATYYWRRRTPRALANSLRRPHVFMSLRTTSPVKARRLATQLDTILEDAAMLAENTDLHLSPSQIDTMLRAVVERHLTKLERVAVAAKTAPGFDVDQARSDDKRALWTYTLLDAQGATAIVRPEDRVRMIFDGLSDADIGAVERHLAMLQMNALVPTKHHVLWQMIEGVAAEPTAMSQANAGKFVDFLYFEIFKHYGKSVRDEHLTIAQLREKGRLADKESKSEKSQCGLSSGTVNRHLTFLSQIFDYASARGLENLDKIDLSKLRAKSDKNTRDRNERPKLPIDRAMAIYRTPPFNNCASWDALGESGAEGAQQIFHCALYFVPILIYYTGCRREELCGLMVDDVIVDHGDIPYLHIAKNERRRIKNAQSQRNVPLHPEVIRLNFLAYVKAIKALGYKLLFPDLYSPSSRSPLGDRFYKQFKPILEAAGVTETGLGSHAVRHLFGAQLKKKHVAVEDRADLLGHGGDTETSERYCEPHEIATLLKFVKELPVVTADLQPREINLIPWVAEKQVAPFSHPSRSKR